MTGTHQLFPDGLIFALAVRSGGGHDKACPAVFVQVSVEIRDPQIISVSYLFVFIDGRQAKG